jgi:outer membrane protein assembly factor BamB
MSKKLLIAVLTLGFLFALGGAALGSDTPDKDRDVLRSTNANAPLLNRVTPLPTKSFQKPPQEDVVAHSVSVLPPAYYCDYIDYSGGDFAFFIRIPAASGADFYNMRFDAAAGYACTLLTAWPCIYVDAFTGTPDVKVIVWDDDGYGLPGAELASVIIPYASIPAGGAYMPADFSSSNLVFEDGENYFVGLTAVKVNPTDQIAMLVDDGTVGTGRSNIWLPNATPPPAGYFYNRASNGMTDFNFGIGVDICCADLPYSSCYTQEYDCGPTYYFTNPNAWGVDYFNTRFSVDGPETLVDVGIALYAGASTGTPDLDLYVWGSSAGFPDLSDVIFQTTVPNASIAWYPSFTEVPVGLVVRNDFHLGFAMPASGVLAALMDDASCGAYRSSAYFGGWISMFDLFGEDNNWLMYADLCKDEFSVCDRIVNYCDPYYIYSMPHSGGNGRVAGYEKIEPFGLGCRLEEVRVATDNPIYYGYPAGYQYDAQLEIRADSLGYPGPYLATKFIAAGGLAEFPALNEWDVTALNIIFDAPIWVGVRSLSPTPTSGPDFYLVGDDDACGGDNAVIQKISGVYQRFTGSNFLIDAYVCCVPPPERACLPTGEDWVTSGHDFRRTAASNNSTGDAQCQQKVLWWKTDAAGYIYNRPIIYDGIVLSPLNTKLQAHDINTNALLWTITGLPYIGTGFRNSVTVKDGFVYFGGGNGRSFSKSNVYTGANVWSRNVLNTPLTGNTVYTTSVILTCGTTEVVFLGTSAGMLYALDATTGANYPGWAVNPKPLDGDLWETLSSNGSDVLYLGTGGEFGTGEGTVYAIDACTGTELWTLGEGDLAGATLSGLAEPGEQINGPIAVDLDGAIYFQSFFLNTAGSPSGAVYKVSPAGNIVWFAAAKYTWFSGPVIDANEVYITSRRAWTSEDQNTWALKKLNGSVKWESDEMFNVANGIEGALSCEELAPDLLYAGNFAGQFVAINTEDGSIPFEYNYVVGASNRANGIAIDASHVVLTNRQGDMYVLANDVDRPRLRILKTDEFFTVPFFSPPHFPVEYADVFMNTGCVVLSGNITASATPSPAYAWTVNPNRINRLITTADEMVSNSYPEMARHLIKNQPVDASEADREFAESPYSKDMYSDKAAYAFPPWLNSIVVTNFNLGPGQAFTVQYDVNGGAVNRGPQRCYVTINATNDQYFLNNTADPVVQLGVLGGCLQSDDAITFGTTDQNALPVFNTGEMGNQNGSQLWTFDGETNRYWQGGLFFAADEHRMAWTTDSWHGADPPDFWNSLLPDPNCYDLCEPYITPSVGPLGPKMWDGSAYVDVEGYASVAAYVDSVINFDCYGTGWDWSNNECPYDNALTLGLHVQQFMYGAVGVPELNNVVVFRHDVTNRNAAPISIYASVVHDFDLDATYNRSDYFDLLPEWAIAYGAPYEKGTPTDIVVYGTGTLPYNVNPLINIRTLDAAQAFWETNNVGLDSMYRWMSTQVGETYQAGIVPYGPGDAGQDRNLFATLLKHDFLGNETYTFGTYVFGFAHADATDPQIYADLAKLVNQYCGFGRGDIDGDGIVNLRDVVLLVNLLKPDPVVIPLFQSTADVNCDGALDAADALYLGNYYFCVGPAPVDCWALTNICP